MKRRLCTLALFSLAALPALAQDFPTKPITVVVPFPAGGYVDSFARVVTAKIGPALGQTMPVVNRPGAGGTLGAESVSRAVPDGYTLLISGVSSLAIFQASKPKAGEPELPKLSYVSVIASTPGVMTTSKQSGITSFKELVARMKAEPAKHSYGSAGPGTPSHLWSAEIVRENRIDVTHVAYKGGAPALQELANGQIIWMIDTPIGSLPLVRAGRLTPLAVIAPSRIKQLPDTPSIGELGIPELADKASVLYIAAPPGTPAAIIERLNAVYNAAIRDPEFAARVDSFDSILPAPGITPKQATEAAERDYRGWYKLAVSSGIKVE
jgi:tripartite-type tricarboxylate transporter receptor subunit TctC